MKKASPGHWSDFVMVARKAAIAEAGPAYCFDLRLARYFTLAPAARSHKWINKNGMQAKARWAKDQHFPDPRFWPEGTFPKVIDEAPALAPLSSEAINEAFLASPHTSVADHIIARSYVSKARRARARGRLDATRTVEAAQKSVGRRKKLDKLAF